VIEVLKKMANAGQSPEAADSQPAKDSAGCRVKQEVKKYTLSLSSK
jgi:hypothetical protein